MPHDWLKEDVESHQQWKRDVGPTRYATPRQEIETTHPTHCPKCGEPQDHSICSSCFGKMMNNWDYDYKAEESNADNSSN